MKQIGRFGYTSQEYSTTLFINLDSKEHELVPTYNLKDGDVIRGTVLGLFNIMAMLITPIYADFNFEVKGTSTFYNTNLYLPKDLVLDYGVDEKQYLDILLNEIIYSEKHSSVSIYPKRTVNSPSRGSYPKYDVAPAKTISDLLLTTDLKDPYYSRLKSEINKAYHFKLYTATLVLVRKLFENLIFDLFRSCYGMDRLDLFYNEDRGMHHSLGILIYNLKQNIDDFKVYTHAFHKDKDFFKFLDEMKENCDANTHSIDILPDPDKINSWKSSINKYSELIIRTIEIINNTPKHTS